MRIFKRILIYILCASLLLIFTGCTKKDKINGVKDINTSRNSINVPQKQLLLDIVLEKINNEQDKNLLTTKFKKIVIIQDPLERLENYEGACKTVDGSIQSTAYGLEGTYKVSTKTHMLIRLIFDDTEINGGYISTVSSNTADTSIFRYKSFFVIFETTIDSTDNSVIINELKESLNFKKRFYNILKNIIELNNMK